STQGMQRPAPRPPAARDGAPPRPGMPRPNPAMMPKQSGLGSPAQARPGGGRPGGGRPGGGGGARPGGFSGPAGGGRPGGPQNRNNRGGTQGAFGRAGGPVRRGRKSKRAKRQEFDQMQAPAIGGVRVRKGNGETIRLTRG